MGMNSAVQNHLRNPLFLEEWETIQRHNYGCR